MKVQLEGGKVEVVDSAPLAPQLSRPFTQRERAQVLRRRPWVKGLNRYSAPISHGIANRGIAGLRGPYRDCSAAGCGPTGDTGILKGSGCGRALVA